MLRIWHHNKTSKRGPPTKLTDQARRALIREATKRPKITPKELQSYPAEIGVSVHRTTLTHTLSWALWKSGQKKAFAKRHVGDSPNIWKQVLWSDETKM